MAAEEDPKVKKYGANIPTTDEYEDWTWKQIEAAIVGGVDQGNTQRDANQAEFSVPKTMWDASNIFFGLASQINNALTTFNYNVNALVGEGGPWKGDAAKVAGENFTYFSKAVKTQLDSLTGGDDPTKAVYNNLFNSGNYLNWAINTITAIDEWYADQAAKLGASSHETEDGTKLIHVSDIKGLPEMIQKSMLPVIRTLAGQYRFSYDQTPIPPYAPPMLPPPAPPTAPKIDPPKPPPTPEIDQPEIDPANFDGGNPPDMEPPTPFEGPGGPEPFGGADGPGLDALNADPFNSATTPNDFNGLTSPTGSPLTPFSGGGLSTLPNSVGPGLGGPPGIGGTGGLGTGPGGLGGPLGGFLSAPGRLRSTDLPSSALKGGKFGGGGAGGLGKLGRGGLGTGGLGVDEFGRPIGKGGQALDEFGRPIGKGGVGGRGLAGLSAEAAAARGLGSPYGMPMGGMPMGGMGGRGGQQEQDRERNTWLEEDEDVWGANPDCGPSVLGKQA